METPSRVSALIRSLEENEEKNSRASLSISPSQTPSFVTPEKPRPSSICGDIMNGNSLEDLSQERFSKPPPQRMNPIIDEKEVALRSGDENLASTNLGNTQTVPPGKPNVQFPLENEDRDSRTSSEDSGSSFASPVAIGDHDQALEVPFRQPNLTWDRGDQPESAYMDVFHDATTPAAANEFSPSMALHSHPPELASLPRRSATVPPRRSTSFAPITLATSRSDHWGSEDVIGTPYPRQGKSLITMREPPMCRMSSQRRTDHRQSKPNDSASASISQVTQRPQPAGTGLSTPSKPKEPSLLISIRDASTDTIRSIPLFVPGQGLAAGEPGHDDEELAYRIRDSYLALRGPWKTLFVARCVIGVSLPSNSSPTSSPRTPTRPDRSSHTTDGDAEKGRVPSPGSPRRAQVQKSTSSQLLTLFHNPSNGRLKSELVAAVGEAARTGVSLQLIEGWSVPRVGFAVLVILLASIAATLLWIFLGVGIRAHIELLNAASAVAGGGSNITGQPVPVRIISRSTRALNSLPADRVEPAAILGGLVLLLGWTAVGTWMFLSYLVT